LLAYISAQVGDCGAVHQIFSAQHYNNSAEAAATAALEAGVDWDCYGPFAAYSSAVAKGMLLESTIDRALTRVLTAHVRLGFFDSPAMVSYKRLPPETIDSPAHRELARWAASRVIVLLSNKNNTLPIDFASLLGGTFTCRPNAHVNQSPQVAPGLAGYQCRNHWQCTANYLSV
jgi:beta-glucosidase